MPSSIRPPRRVETPSFVLRPWERRDAEKLSEAVIESQSDLVQWLPWATGDLSPTAYISVIDAFIAAWDDGRDFVYGIVDHDDRVLGGTGLHLRRGPTTMEIGYWVRSSRTGEGIATAVTTALIDTAFTLPEISDVAVAVDVENERSASIPTRLGFKIRETIPAERHATRASGWHNIFVIERSEWVRRSNDGSTAP